ncbi:hypothetical protein QWZ08_03580 [Ferruginibacter paludis]|uniref:hypothetical protein n=1 Tax=Ferruginibacter paludis TaxID=1310417 RepID=UPI0025B2A6B6|nr:hypothetical protein [Ferruginibacter paludis]MDN3654693.1 hypothetical protein [Ferruginibacter paludis]
MPENEFEKEVQQKIVGLKLKPNDEVWQNVAGAITKRKAGRRFFALILLLLFFSMAGLFVIYNGTKQQRKPILATQEDISGNVNSSRLSGKKEVELSKRVDAATDKGTVVKEKITADKLITQKKEGEPLTILIQSAASKEQSVGKTNIAQNEVKTVRNQPDITGASKNGSGKIQYKKKQKLSTKISKGSVEEDRNETATVSDNESKNVEENTALVLVDSAHKYIAVSPVINPTGKNMPSVKDTIESLKQSGENTKSVANKTIHIKQTSKWKLGVNFSAGISATNNQYLGIIGSSNSDANKAYYSADQISTPGNNSQAGTPVYRPSKISSGAGIIAGIFVQKNISPAAILSIGLNYKMYNTTMTVGSQLDSIVPANNYLNLSSAAYRFYRTGASSNYKNHFHFIELPVAVKIALNKKHKRAAYVTTSIAIARLISSNALQFDTASGKYYSNNNLLKKTQANVSVGALFSMSRMTKNPLLIGPEINFGVNKIARENLYGGRRYSYFGLRLQKNFGKK